MSFQNLNMMFKDCNSQYRTQNFEPVVPPSYQFDRMNTQLRITKEVGFKYQECCFSKT